MSQSTQRKMLRLITQTKRRYKKIVKQKIEIKENDDTQDLSSTEDENGDGQSSDTHDDQDSNISFEKDTDDEIHTTEIEEENWIAYKKEAPKKSLIRWMTPSFDAGARHTKE